MHSAEITVREGDIDAAGDDDTRVERAELDSGHFPLRDRDAWYGFSLLLPKGFPIVDDRLVIADPGHYESEQFTADLLFEILRDKFPNFAVLKSDIITNPVNYY